MERQDTHNTVYLTSVDQRITIDLLYMVTQEMQVVFQKNWYRGCKIVSSSTQLNMKLILLINVEMSALVAF